MSRRTAIFSLIVLFLSLFSSQAQVQIVNAKTAGEVANDFAVEINSVSISTDGRVMHYSGIAEPGAYVQVNLENNETGEIINLGETQADEKGNWEISYQSALPLSAGMHTAQATSSSSAGSKTAQSQPVVFKVFYFIVLVVALILTLMLRFVLPKLITKIGLFSKEEPRPPKLMHVKPRGPPFVFTTYFSPLAPLNFIPTKQFQKDKLNRLRTILVSALFLTVGVWPIATFVSLPQYQEQLRLDKVFYSSNIKYNTSLSYSDLLFRMKKQLNQSKNSTSLESSRLFLAISLLEKSQDVIQLLYDLFSPEELENLCKRFEIIELLAKGASYNEIEKKVGVSVGTIAKASSRFNKDYGGYKIQIERIVGNGSKEKKSGGAA